ncbi:protein ENHANCED DISEASE RESISTANCE 4-like [Panicum virgatum]|nr:protein ENHANCED DISEASE RESISTANCE 4-like [Panicum virgatum]
MENSDTRPVRRVRCPRCLCVLEEPGAPVYQCGGCGTSLRAKNRIGDTAKGASPSRSERLPPQSRHLDSTDVASTSRSLDATTSSRHRATDATSRHEFVSATRHGSGDVASTSSTPTVTSSRRQGTPTRSQGESAHLVASARKHDSGDVASTSSSTPGAATSRRQGADATSRRESGDLVDPVSEQVALMEKRGHNQSAAAQVVSYNSEGRRQGDAGGSADRSATSSPKENKIATTTSEVKDDDTEKRMKRQAESPDAARKKHSGEATVQPQHNHRQELAPKSTQAPSRQQEVQAENLGPLRKKIMKTVDELKGDLSELFSKSPELINPTPRARPPRLPKQQGYVSRAAVAPSLHARARHAAAAAAAAAGGGHRQAAVAPPRGLPSRRYRQCRADPCGHNAVQPTRSCHHGCCRHHGKPECRSCRGHCCRPRTQQEPPSSAPRKPQAGKRRLLPPRNHCRPVLKGAPFIICSSCFKLVQVPADFAAVSTKTVRKLRCGSCSTVLSYSYRDPARKKAYLQDSLVDQLSADDASSELQGGQGPDPFAPFVDGFGLSSYSTDDGQALHVSRNTSFDTIDGTKGVGRLHRLMGYGSASELLRHSPDLYESFSERTTPDLGHHDRKGKGVWVDDNDYDVDDSDEEDGGALMKRSAGRGFGWPLPATGMPGKGIPAPGAIRIK